MKGETMKNIVLALALVAGATLTSQAQASNLAAPFWGCRLKANIVETVNSVELLIIRGEKVVGYGTVACTDVVGQTKRQNVMVTIKSGGIGPAINGPLQGLTVYAVRAGVATTDGMAGKYRLSAGPRLGLIAARVGVMAGVQVSGQGIGAGIEAVIENRFSIGIDLGGMSMTVVPTGRAVRTRY